MTVEPFSSSLLFSSFSPLLQAGRQPRFVEPLGGWRDQEVCIDD